jgi:hypothetical protein
MSTVTVQNGSVTVTNGLGYTRQRLYTTTDIRTVTDLITWWQVRRCFI